MLSQLRTTKCLLGALLLLVLAACGKKEPSPRYDDGDGGGKLDDGSPGRVYSCTEPEWDDADWLKYSKCYYVVDVRAQYFNDWCYRTKACAAGQPPPGKTVDDIVENHDRLSFLTSLQGLVNRDRPTLYLVAETKPDEEWLKLLADEKIWLTDMKRVDVATMEDALALFAKHPAVQGSVQWTDTEPYTMNIAFSLAGAENLVVVRSGSVVASKITDLFPLKQDLGGKFASKRAAYEWLIDNYLKTEKLAPEVALYPDGWSIHASKTGPFNTDGFGMMPRDYLVAHKQFVIGYGVNAKAPDPAYPAAPKGEGRVVLQKVFDAIRTRVGPSKMFTAVGWPPSEYSFDCNDDGVINSSDNVSCEEWEWTRFLSTNGGMERMGGAGAYAKEAANATFFAHGPGIDLLVQPPPLSPQKLLEKGYVIGPPRNFSFEAGDGEWTLQTTNRSIVNDAAQASHGSKFLQVNVSAADVGKSIFQNVTLPLTRGQHYRFVIHARGASPGPVQITQRVTVANGATTLCTKAATVEGPTWKALSCDFQVVTNGIANPRLEVTVDTADKTVALDEAYLLGATSMEVNPFRKYALFYVGDYDFTNALLIVPVGVHPFPWTTPATSLPVGYSIPSDASAQVPPIFAYFAKTRTQNQWFVMPDSGAGYVNPGYLPQAVIDDWKYETTSMQRPFSFRTGWVLNGHGTGDVAANNATGARIRAMYRVLAPEGIYYNGVLGAARLFEGGLPVLPMDSGTYAGQAVAAAATAIKGRLDGSPSAFNVFRTVFVSDKQIEDAVNLIRTQGTAVDVLDPITFMYLFRQSQGAGTVGRMSVIAHDLPSVLNAGATATVHITVRNDGWDTWVSKPEGRTDCDGSGTAGAACERLAWGLNPGTVAATGLGAAPTASYTGRESFPTKVLPGESIEVTFQLTAPNAPGAYTFQVDGVKELRHFFETVGNVPWQKRIEVR